MLTQLKEHPDSWTKVDAILAYSNNLQTKVQLVLVQSRLLKSSCSILLYNCWKMLLKQDGKLFQESSVKVSHKSIAACLHVCLLGIKKFIVGLVIKHSANPNMSEVREHVYCDNIVHE